MLNLNKVGRNLCIINGGKYKNKLVSVSEEEDDTIKQFKSMKLTDGKFQQIPNLDTERECGFITGPSGSGKSTLFNILTKLEDSESG